MMLIWKDQGTKNKRKSNGSSTSRLPFEEFNEEDDVDFDHNNGDMYPLQLGKILGKIYNYRFKMCSWAMQIIKVDGMEHQGEENRMGSKRIGWKFRSKPQTHFTHILFIGLAQYNEERS